MRASDKRNGVLLLGLALGLGGVASVSCSSDSSSKKPTPSNEAGAAGEGGEAPRGTAGAGNVGGSESSVAGAAGAPLGAAGAAGAIGAGQSGEGGASGAPCAAPVTGRITIDFDATDPERVTTLKWTNSAATLTANLAASGGQAHCTDPQEFFGQSYGAPEGALPDPVVGGHLASLVQCGADATISSAEIGCEPAGAAQLPVTTQYHFYTGTRASEMRVTRTFGFGATTQPYAGTTGLRPYVPRVPISALPNVIYPNQAGTAVTAVAASTCGGDCITPTGASWSGKWFADVDPTSGLALIVVRDPSLTSAVDLTVNNDASSGSNLASFVLVQPAAGWKAPVTEIEYLCFADLTSWPKTARDAAQLPAGCGP